MGVHNIETKAQWDDALKDDKVKVKVVDFFALWCGPCKAIAPKIIEFSNGYTDTEVKFYKLDVDLVPDVAQEVGVRAMPTFMLYDVAGEKINEVVGANPPAVQSAIDAALKEAAEKKEDAAGGADGSASASAEVAKAE